MWVMALFEMPSGYLMISAAMRGIDPSLEESFFVLGGDELVTAYHVILRLLRAPIPGATLFVFSSVVCGKGTRRELRSERGLAVAWREPAYDPRGQRGERP